MKFTIILFIIGSLWVLPAFLVNARKPVLTTELIVTHVSGSISAKLGCYFERVDDAKFEWQRQSGKYLPQNHELSRSTLNFPKIYEDHSGVYFCKTYNYCERSKQRTRSSRSIKIDFNTLMAMREDDDRKVHTRVTILKTPKGKQVILECFSPQDFTYEWAHNGRSLQQVRGEKKYVIELRNTQLNQGGKYSCISLQPDSSGIHHRADIILDLCRLELVKKGCSNNIEIPPQPKPIREEEVISVRLCRNDGGDITMTVRCNHPNDREVTIDWSRRDKGLSARAMKYRFTTFSELVIDKFQRSDEGIYYCKTVKCGPSRKVVLGRAEKSVSLAAQRNIEPCIPKEPQENVSPEDPSNTGREVTLEIIPQFRFNDKGVAGVLLTCRDVNSKLVNVHWRREGNKLFSERVTTFPRSGYSLLDIWPIQKNDYGVYYCETVGSNPSERGHRAVFRLSSESILGKPCGDCPNPDDPDGNKFTTISPGPDREISLEITSEFRCENKDTTPVVLLYCRDVKRQTVNIAWRREDKRLSFERFKTYLRDETKVMEIWNFQADDEGVYYCETFGSNPSQTVYSPSFRLSLEEFPSYRCRGGSTTKKPDRNDPATRRPEPIITTSTVTASPITRPTTHRPSVGVLPENRVAEEYDIIEFHCDSEPYGTNFRWSRKDGQNFSDVSVINDNLLTIYGGQYGDAGVYICEYRDSFGDRRTEHNLKVKKFGTIDEDEPCYGPQPGVQLLNCEYPESGRSLGTAKNRVPNLRIGSLPPVKLHSEITLNCYDESRLPVLVHWRRSDGKRISAGALINNGCLTIPRVQSDDAGIYICETSGNSPSTVGESVMVGLLIETPRFNF